MNAGFTPDMILSSTIEVGIAIAGFTGIVIALTGARRLDGKHALYLSVLLLTSIASVFFAFLPMLLGSSGIDEAWVWRISSACFLAYIVVVLAYRSRQLKSLRPTPGLAVRIGGGFFASAVVLQVGNVVWIRAAWPYLILMVSYLIYSFSVFVTLLWDIADGPDGASGGI